MTEIRLGTVLDTGKPLLVPRSRLGHVHARGITGSGKTSMVATPLIAQLLEPYVENGETRKDPIIVIDLGGDQGLFHTCRKLAENAKRRFRYLTLDPDLHSFYFPPFQAIPPGEKNILSMAMFLVTAMHMDHGLVYGGAYYTAQNTSALLEVARRISRDSAPVTLEDVSEFLEAPANRRLFKDADQVRMAISFLCQCPFLNEGGSPDEDILFDRALEESEVIYFFVPTLTEPQTARIVAGLALWTAVQAAIRRKKTGKEKRVTRMFVDEFQSIVGANLGNLLAQTRKFHVFFTLLNQSTSQLENSDVKLADIVFEGCSTKIYFTCIGKRDTEDLQALSGETTRVLGGTSSQKFSESQSKREVLAPRLEPDTILKVSSTFGEAFAVLNHGDGKHQPIIIKTTHQFRDLSHMPMPARQGAAVKDAPEKAAPEKSDEWQRLREGLSTLLLAKRAQEEWDGTGCEQAEMEATKP